MNENEFKNYYQILGIDKSLKRKMENMKINYVMKQAKIKR